jgi:hypothetical protein
MKFLYVIGSKNKSTFLGWDDISQRLMPVYHYEQADIMSKRAAEDLLEVNKYTHFYLEYDLHYLYPVLTILL